MKPEPFMLDMPFDSSKGAHPRHFLRHVSARRFRVELETARKIAQLFDTHRTLYEEHRGFAKPPFEETYVEFTLPSQDFVFGVLRTSTLCTICARPKDQGADHVRIMPWRVEVQKEGLQTNYWSNDGGQDAGSEGLRLAAAIVGFTEVLWLLMHRPGLVKAQHFPTTQKIIKGRLRPFRAHDVLTIDLSAKDLVKTIQANGSRGPNREHMVRGTWVHIGISRVCTHNWIKVEMPPEKPERYECSRCKGIRVWRRDHVRGDASLGTKFHDYHVKG